MLSRIKWLTLLSLDAPLVAVAWQALFARSLGSQLKPHHFSLVFASVWLGYVADRWIDNLKRTRPTSQQHTLYARHKLLILGIWILVLVATVTLAFSALQPAELARGFLLMLAAMTYTLFAQRTRAWSLYPIAKALFTGGLILASALLFQNSNSLPLVSFLGVWLLFTSNCLLIRSWNASESQHPRFRAQAYSFAVSSLICGILGLFSTTPSVAIATVLSAIGLAAVELGKERTDLSFRRTAADLALLSPLVFLFF